MKVRELIARLSELDPEAEVWMTHFEEGDVAVGSADPSDNNERAPDGSVFIKEVPARRWVGMPYETER